MTKKTVLIIGAGIGGLSAAALLAKKGYQVTVVEKNEQPGGRASVLKKKGYTFDMGPSWYLMPDVFERFFKEFQKKPSDFYQLVRLDPSYRIFFERDDIVDIPASLKKTKQLFRSLEVDGDKKLQNYLDLAEYAYQVSMDKFLYKEYSSITDFFDKQLLLEGRKLQVFQNLDSFTKKIFTNERLRKILLYNLVFLGGTPKITPAIYSVMAHVDFNMGVWYPKGGMGKVVETLVQLGKQYGVRYIYNCTVSKIVIENKIATAVKTPKGILKANIILSNADLPYSEEALLDSNDQTYPKEYWSKKIIAPSAFIIFLGLKKKLRNLKHHNLFLHHDWIKHFDSIFKKTAWPDEPSYYVCCPSKTDSSVAPKGKENLFILVPVAPGLTNTTKFSSYYAKKIIAHLEQLTNEPITPYIEVQEIFGPTEFKNRYNAYKGTALGLTHTLMQTALFRPSHKSKKVKNLFYTGQYTTPGIGVPITLISSQIAVNEIEKFEGNMDSRSSRG